MSKPGGQVSRASQWLESHTAMPPHAARALAALVPGLLARIPRRHGTSLGIAGPPGSGKSTLARLLSFMLNESGTPTVLLSLDDYYLSRQDREALAQGRHTLLRRRGVPGTHDWQRFIRDFDCLREGDATELRLPVFDKATDDIAPRERWRAVKENPLCVLVEGWCIGAPAQDAADLTEPVNELERREDSRGIWRAYVNACLGRYCDDLAPRIGRYWYLQVPAWDCVIDWRWQQEQELAQARLHSRAETAAFLATFERIVRHMQASAAAWAECRLRADSAHRLQVMP